MQFDFTHLHPGQGHRPAPGHPRSSLDPGFRAPAPVLEIQAPGMVFTQGNGIGSCIHHHGQGMTVDAALDGIGALIVHQNPGFEPFFPLVGGSHPVPQLQDLPLTIDEDHRLRGIRTDQLYAFGTDFTLLQQAAAPVDGKHGLARKQSQYLYLRRRP